MSNLTIDELDKKIYEYKSNLNQVETILERERENIKMNPSKLEDLIKLRDSLKQAIRFHDDVKKFKISNIGFSTNLMTNEDIGRICSCYFESDDKWYTAMVKDVNEKENTATVTFFGLYNIDSNNNEEVNISSLNNKNINAVLSEATLPFKYIKIQEKLSPIELSIGMFVEAIYYEDGLWYQAIIEQISEYGVHIKYLKYTDKEIVSFDSIRLTPELKLKNEDRNKNKKLKNNLEDEMVFKLPDNLKISPADNEQQRLSKKKKAKALKNNHKQKILEKISKEKQDSWLNFVSKAQKNKNGAFSFKRFEGGAKLGSTGEFYDVKPIGKINIDK